MPQEQLTGNRARILHFRGKGYAVMAGVEEYVVLLEAGDDCPAEDQCCPGFELHCTTDIETCDCRGMPACLPYRESLVKHHRCGGLAPGHSLAWGQGHHYYWPVIYQLIIEKEISETLATLEKPINRDYFGLGE